MTVTLTESDRFSINVKEICYGNETLEIVFGDHVLEIMPSYMGPEPLSTLIDSLNEFELGYKEDDDSTTWSDEPGCWKLKFVLDRNTFVLNILISHYDDGLFRECKGEKEWEFSVSMPYQKYRTEVIRIALFTLKRYGLRGINGNWCDGTDSFAINGLIRILGSQVRFEDDKDEYYSDIFSELDILKKALESIDLEIPQETMEV